MEVCQARDIHPHQTRLNHLWYRFTPKHHGWGAASDACWLRHLQRAEEFAVFDMADWNQLSDDSGNLYGLLIREIGDKRELMKLGTRNEQVARFWAESADNPWHGHPLGAQRVARHLAKLNRAVQPGVLSLSKINHSDIPARISIGHHREPPLIYFPKLRALGVLRGKNSSLSFALAPAPCLTLSPALSELCVLCGRNSLIRFPAYLSGRRNRR
jgi:hypothetical protein